MQNIEIAVFGDLYVVNVPIHGYIGLYGVVPVAHQKYAHRKMPTTICPRPFAHQIHKPTAKSPPKPKAHRQLPTDKCPRQKAHQWLWANIRGQIAVGK